MLTLLLFILFLIIIFIKNILNSNNYWKKRNVKQVNGVIWRFVTSGKALPVIYREIYDANPNLPHIGTYLGVKPALILRDTENIQAVLHGDFYSFYDRGFNLNDNDHLGDNLLFADKYMRWRLTRQKLSPFFSNVRLKMIFGLINRCARDFVKQIDEKPEIIKANSFNAIYTYNSACITSAVFGIDEKTQNVMDTPFNEIVKKVMTTFLITNLKFALSNISPKLFCLLNIKAFAKHEKMFIEMMKHFMNKRRNDTKTYNDFIDTCLKFQDEGVLKDFVTGYETDASIEYLAAQAFVFLLGGIDTTGNALHFTLIELSNNPSVLQKLHKEIDEIFKNNGGNFTFEDLYKMKYTDMVINEALRKYPPIGKLQRKCRKETVLPVGKVKIDENTVIVVPTYAIHYDEQYFPNPELFDPERFSAENVSKITKFSYLPFGAGNRYCIASKLSKIMMKTCIAWFLKKYTLKEQSYTPKDFEPSFFGLHDAKAHFEVISRTE